MSERKNKKTIDKKRPWKSWESELEFQSAINRWARRREAEGRPVPRQDPAEAAREKAAEKKKIKEERDARIEQEQNEKNEIDRLRNERVLARLRAKRDEIEARILARKQRGIERRKEKERKKKANERKRKAKENQKKRDQ